MRYFFCKIQIAIFFITLLQKLCFVLVKEGRGNSICATEFADHHIRDRRDTRYDHLDDLIEHSNNYDEDNYAVYFSGNEIIRYENMNFNLDNFTIDFWAQLEGGQHNNVSIITIFNHCSVLDVSAVTIGLIDSDQKNNMKVFFHLQTEYQGKGTMLLSHEFIHVYDWFHVAVVYDGRRMTLYINQAKVDVSHEQSGPFLLNLFHKCTTFEVGGDSIKHVTIRGSLDKIRVWNQAKSHSDIVQNTYDTNKQHLVPGLILYEEFLSLNSKTRSLKYYGVTGILPKLIKVKLSKNLHRLKLDVPNCGQTICDNPEVIRNYAKYPELFRTHKILRYRIINIADTDGGNAILTHKDIDEKDKQINQIFAKYNITWKLSIHLVKNSYLRNKTVTIKCYGHCEDERENCKANTDFPSCKTHCSSKNVGDTICNPECNKPNNDASLAWDGGDCCNPLYTNVSETCFDLKSPNRAFLKESELKDIVNLDNRFYLNIFPVKLRHDMVGKATFPWLRTFYSKHGGTSINVNSFRHTPIGNEADIIHELGHNLGLWHVHKGVSNLFHCDDACAEVVASMVHGDLCDDTNPTPMNLNCQDEVSNDECGSKTYKNTPYRNFMAYSSGGCANEFTQQQTARMHCYIDHFYQELQVGDQIPPSPVPTKARVLSASIKHVHLAWFPPIRTGKQYTQYQCHRCKPGSHSLKQYAKTAYSPQDSIGATRFGAVKAIGEPDVDSVCHTDIHAWLPQYGCGSTQCLLEVSFDHIVIPTGIKIWITYNAKNSIRDIKLVHSDNTVTSLGPGTTHCTIPYSKQITTAKLVVKVQIFVNGIPGIDAVQLISNEHHPHCEYCKDVFIKYNVFRTPGFKQGSYKTVDKMMFIDSEVSGNSAYEYRVQAVSNGRKSMLSPPLRFKLKSGYCGNGMIENQSGEECDDGNVRNGDGCSIDCTLEAIFNCKEEPSLCYRHDRDGVCENFEKKTNIHDCGFFTPKGFVDQWAQKVIGKTGQSNKVCPENVIVGKPASNFKCVHELEEIDSKLAWRPCEFLHNGKEIMDYWIEASYRTEVVAAAVIIYLASDGSKGLIVIELKDTESTYHKATNKETRTGCGDNPMAVHVMHDMTQPVFKTKAVRIKFDNTAMNIAISAIALRSAETDLYHKCGANELYDPRAKTCRPVEQDAMPCEAYKMQNAKFNCSGNNDGDICHVTCNLGYRPSGPFFAKCYMGTWKSPSKCQPVDCGAPKFKHTIAECSITTYGSACSFKCAESAKFHGTNNHLLCSHSGAWLKANGSCIVACPKPSVKDSQPYGTDTFENDCSKRGKTNFDMGTRCRYRCKPGHRPVRYVTGTVTGGNTVNILCNDDGKWQHDGFCQKITCPELSAIARYLYSCTDGNRYQSVCSTTCLGTLKKTHSIICKSNGEWSHTLDVCKAKGHCPTVLPLPYIDVSSCQETRIGSVCRPQCKMKRNHVIPEIIIKGLEHAKDSVAIYCMPNKRWYPSPKDIQCVEPCITYELGDGICDCHNNHQRCRYDGGDCCATALDKTVFFFLESSPKCPCIDPKAIEHLKKLKRKKSKQS